MAELRLEQGVLRLQTGGGSDVLRVPLQDGDVARFQRWAAEYEAAVPRDDEAALLALGRDIHAWLDARSLQALGEEERDIRFATPLRPDADERAFLAVPWELLADRDGFWALDVVTPYHPARLLGRAGSPAVPPHQDVQLLFMAAQPLNQTELDYEAEEAGILGAVKGQPVRLVVEESGALTPLRDRVAQGAPWEALHLSCHGDVDDELGPVLALEPTWATTTW